MYIASDLPNLKSMKLTSYPLFFALILVFLSFACSKGQSGHATKGQNRLAQAKSPYLQQHADNPVHWYEWSPEALEKAQKEDKPLLISVGYAACHWCHVMEHESFMDSSVARLMNDNYVAIKIDREERPDIDQIYMNAAQLINGSGGWPLNAFATPDGRPFYAATYFPKDQWVQVLTQIKKVYDEDRAKINEQANLLTEGIQNQEFIQLPGDSTRKFKQEQYLGIFKKWESLIDFQKGGYSRAPKFPLPTGWEFLLQYYYFTQEEKAYDAVCLTLDEMAKGGIYDQIGGGFARYSTDARWFAPHFEKMLYDNGQLISLYAHAYQIKPQERYANIIRETIAFVERELSDPSGGFYSSINADSEDEEGKFYVWTQEEIENVLGAPSASLVSEFYQVEADGNWEKGKNILYRKEESQIFAQKKDLELRDWQKVLKEAQKKILDARETRVRPSTDDKILTSWNALMLMGYLDAYQALGDKHYVEQARKNAQFLKAEMHRPDGGLWRNYKDGEAGIQAFLDDYALLAQAYIELYQVTLDVAWLNTARKLVDYAILHFRDEQSGMFYYTSDESESLVARKMELSDNVIPSSNSVMAHVLYRLGAYFYEARYTQMSKIMLNHMAAKIDEGGPYYANWAQLMGLIQYEPYEVAIMGPEAADLNREFQKQYLPTTLFMGGSQENLPLLENKLVSGQTRIYVCRNKVCKLPVKQVEQALKQINHLE